MARKLARLTSGAIVALAAAAAWVAVPALAANAKMNGSDLQSLLLKHDFLALKAALAAESDVPAPERAFYSGVIANRRNRAEESLRLLKPVLDHPPASLAPDALRLGYDALASSSVKLFRYGEAEKIFARMGALFGKDLNAADAADLEERRRTMELLAAAPPQSVNAGKPARLATSRNALGLTEIPVGIGGETTSWLFDTGANFSLMVRSAAEALHLKLSSGTTAITRAGGAKAEAHVAIVPEMTIGNAHVRNVVVLVVEDKDFYFERARFQLKEVLGYPVLSALGRITIGRDGSFSISAQTKNAGTTELWLDGQTPLVAVKPDDERPQLFVLDSGSGHSFLSVRFYEDNREQFAGKTPGQIALGTRTVQAFGLRGLSFGIGEAKASLDLVAVAAAESGTPTDLYYGAIGQDILNQFQSYTLDFGAMTFSVGPKAEPARP